MDIEKEVSRFGIKTLWGTGCVVAGLIKGYTDAKSKDLESTMDTVVTYGPTISGAILEAGYRAYDEFEDGEDLGGIAVGAGIGAVKGGVIGTGIMLVSYGLGYFVGLVTP